MRALGVLSPSLAEKLGEADKYVLEIDSLKIPLALIHVPDIELDENNENNSDMVLVKKKGFSLNYRDFGVIENAWHKLKKSDQDTYYPIGSEFCGEVLKIGKTVNNLKVGDYVIANCAYPIAPFNATPGIPSNHGSKELEIFHKGKLIKVPKNIPVEQAAGMSIGIQTAISMLRKADIKDGQNVLVTSVTSNTSLIILNFLRDKNCTIYGLSYSGKETKKVKEQFPFIKTIYNFKDNNIPKNLFFDAVLDPFADTHIVALQPNLNFEAHYVTCGMFNQSSEKIQSKASYTNLPSLISNLISKNIQIRANCLGTTEDLENGLKMLSRDGSSNIPVDEVFNRDEEINLFLDKSFLKTKKIGKTVFIY
ncbi:alcohol dehydrogenase catalytic domain-containing protein [uncultured Lacinutrix sp.]|uniref:alcohol dehydrogenase catalytic domain-containing protein n=1 Tax=uncultured Lacinutrix sp. TaxID=574032 RepID=UPI00260A7585|nr:alcohol dehydrogenase catalytic domain-containing protein [uncultured Lacinutrix sp.]